MTALLVSVLVLAVISIALNLLVLATLGEMLASMTRGVVERERARQIAVQERERVRKAVDNVAAIVREARARVPCGQPHYDA